MLAAVRRYTILRRVPDPPFTRFACYVIDDPAAEGGYRIDGGDPAVMSPDLIHGIRETFRLPAQDMEGGKTASGASWDRMVMRYPGDPGYIAAAVHHIPGTLLGADPR